ncbi:hypothetical protein [Acidianus brierleyi]|uniref:Uncharacterized protein n=1 Tax=Acidianus brierleyi TaxID=41673 RepID=A0A2U9IG14_9CREN|nr:hypothetical protein [Acidianus brierleyi]AWR94981.1 hypothetical protein DFR85_10615 [Acidianus brierleyi]
MSTKFSVKLLGGRLILENISGRKLLIREIILRYKVSTITPEKEVGLKTISDEIRMEKEIENNSKVEIPLTINDVVEISIIYKDGDFTLREDISL